MQENTASCACFIRKRITKFMSEIVQETVSCRMTRSIVIDEFRARERFNDNEHYSYQKIR